MTCSNIYDLRKIPIYYEELKGKKINYCLRCNTCQKNGGTCVYKDDVPEILEK